MQMYNYSFREVIVILERELKRKLPSLSTLHYRLSKLDNKLLEKIILKISKEIIKKKILERNISSVTAILITRPLHILCKHQTILNKDLIYFQKL